jgi:Response regulators consisting of a CheY-like receiver domain and a winged-helix DNA-binding domain
MTSKKNILIIEDEFDIREFLSYNLSKEGYSVNAYENPLEALNAIRHNPPDLLLTDWLMPEMDGIDVCKTLKMNQETSHIPIIMITCKSEETDVVTALEIGADDYLTKPFRVKELLVRIKKYLKRNEYFSGTQPDMQGSNMTIQNDAHRIKVNGLIIDQDNHTVTLDGQKLSLTFSEFRLLELLASRPGKVFTRNQIIENGFGNDYYVTDRSVDVKIVGLRKKLGKYENMIETIRSVGYKFSQA